jgi:hypothetical protein
VFREYGGDQNLEIELFELDATWRKGCGLGGSRICVGCSVVVEDRERIRGTSDWVITILETKEERY